MHRHSNAFTDIICIYFYIGKSLQRGGKDNWLTSTFGFVDYTAATERTASDKFKGRWISTSS